MNWKLLAAFVLPLVIMGQTVQAQQRTADIPYVGGGHKLQTLDVYSPDQKAAAPLPVVFWIHGGGWQTGDKADVALKPKVLTERGFVFVSTNYRLLPEVEMGTLIRDVARALGWVSKHIAEFGGDPKRIIVAGHSAGAQLAAILCTDERYVKEQGVSFADLKGCVPVDGDTFDILKIITTAELRQSLYGGRPITNGHRQKFGNDPEKHVDFSAVTHVAPGKNIPPFLILYFSGNPDTTVQARRLEEVLRAAEIPAQAVGKSDTNHRQLNNELGTPDDPATQAFQAFLDRCAAGGKGAAAGK